MGLRVAKVAGLATILVNRSASELTHFYAQFSGPDDEVRVGGGAERISHDQERHILVFGCGVDAVCFRLHHVAISQDDVLAVKRLLR